ncbi:MAG: hypothetical protein PHQ75_12350 [Thermoguttaceae bacterium]|nr:hypothetical protein [Thermoguttaceae bacterium]
MTSHLSLNRRGFLGASALLAGSALIPSGGSLFATTGAGRIPYEKRLGDRHWMWGHDPGAHDGPNMVYKIPLSEPMSMAEGIKYMGIPNVCVIRGGHPNEQYRAQFKDVKRIAWDLSGGSNKSYYYLKDYVFSLFEKMPNLTGVYLDDFFRGGPLVKQKNEKGEEFEVTPAALSLEEMSSLARELHAVKNPIDLAVVLYSGQLKPSIKYSLDYADVVSFWTWTGKDVMKLRENFDTYRKICPQKKTLLGLYMWDFGGKQPINLDFMKHQLDFALELFRKGEIEGTIFHCTPLCNKNLEAVEYSKKWIAETANETQDKK